MIKNKDFWFVFGLVFPAIAQAASLAHELMIEHYWLGSIWLVSLVGFIFGMLAAAKKLVSEKHNVSSPLKSAVVEVFLSTVVALVAFSVCYMFEITGIAALLVLSASSFFAVTLLDLGDSAVGDVVYSMLKKFGVSKGAGDKSGGDDV